MDLMEELVPSSLINRGELLRFQLIHLRVVVVRQVRATRRRYLIRGPDQVVVRIGADGVLELGDIPLVVALGILRVAGEQDRAEERRRWEVDDIDLDTNLLPGCLRQLLGIEAILAAS